MAFLFENMRVYLKSLEYAEEILLKTRHVPKGGASIADQLRRAAMSIPANLAEGFGRWHKNDRKQFS